MFLIRKPGGDWALPSTTDYANEDELQDLLASSPGLLPIDGDLVVVREFTVPGIGSADLVGITASGQVVIVECKLRANSQIRREVVGQALAYAGGLWQTDIDAFLERLCLKIGRSEDELLRSLRPNEASELRQNIAASLAAGDFRIVIAVDEITDELKTIVEYVNSTASGFELALLELAYSKEDDLEILVPTVYGAEVADAKKSTSGPSHKWTAIDVAQAFDGPRLSHLRSLVDQLLDHAARYGAKFNPGTGQHPAVGCYYLVEGEPTSLWALKVNADAPSVDLSIGALHSRSPERAQSLVQNLGMSQPFAALAEYQGDDFKKYPSFLLEGLGQHGVQTLLEAVNHARDV